jgi:hypothetical protein
MVIVPDLETSRIAVNILKSSPGVGIIDAITEYIPENQQDKIPYLQRIYRYIDDISINPSKGVDKLILEDELQELWRNLSEIEDVAFISGIEDIETEARRTLELVEENLQILNVNQDYDNFQIDFASELQKLIDKLKKMCLSGPLTVDKLPPEVRNKFISSQGNFTIYVYPKDDIWDERSMINFNKLLLSTAGEATGPSIIWARILEYLKKDILLTTSFSALVIFIVLFINFRSFILSLLAMVPVLLALIWTLGTMGFLGLKLNYASIVGIPLILGIGIDDGVHIIHRYLLEGQSNLPFVLRSTGRAILLTTLTTAAGFGSLMLAADMSIWSIGSIVTIGIIYAYLATIFVLTPILKINRKRRK